MQNNTGNIIRQKRKESGFTLNALANKLNISVSNLSRIETGAIKVSTNIINKLVCTCATSNNLKKLNQY